MPYIVTTNKITMSNRDDEEVQNRDGILTTYFTESNSSGYHYCTISFN